MRVRVFTGNKVGGYYSPPGRAEGKSMSVKRNSWNQQYSGGKNSQDLGWTKMESKEDGGARTASGF